MKLIKRIKRLWALSDETLYVVPKDKVSVELQEKLESKDKGFFAGYMTEGEIAQHEKEYSHGWKAFYDKIRGL
jgi:hypothetical protein